MRKLIRIQIAWCFLSIASCSSSAQQSIDSCNRTTREGWEFMLDKIPNQLCLPEETLLYSVYPHTDMNGDGREDVAIRFCNQKLSDGDTLQTAIYFMDVDSSYTLIQKIDKLDVLYFKKTSPDYYSEMRRKTGDLYLYDTLAGKHGNPPERKVIFQKNKIKISMEPGVGEKYQFEYTYDPAIQNWKQTKFIINDDFQDPKIRSIKIDSPPPLITDFDITDYM